MQEPVDTPFDGSLTAEQMIGDISLSGKTAILTGETSGLGMESARVLAAAGASILAGNSRVITLTSLGHQASAIDFTDINYHQRNYNKWQAYCQSKTASSLLAVELHHRYAAQGVLSFSVHPGSIALTNLNRHLSEEEIAGTSRSSQSETKSLAEGAATQVWAATSNLLAGHRGSYLEDCKVAELISAPNMRCGVMPSALDPKPASRLWRASEKLLSESLQAQLAETTNLARARQRNCASSNFQGQ